MWSLIGIAAVLPAAETSRSAGPSSESKPTLSFVAEQGTGFEWRLFDAELGSTTVLLSLNALPEGVFFDDVEPVVYFAEGEEVRKASLGAAGKSARIAPRPSAADAQLEALWLERSSGRVRALLVTEVAEDAVERDGDVVRYGLPDGTRIRVDNDLAWGEPVICSVLELGADGGWAMLERRGGRGGAADAPGCAIMSDLRHERGSSLASLMESYRCGGEGCQEAARAPIPERVERELLARPEAQVMRMLDRPRAGRLLFAAGFGDTWHAFPPFFFVRTGAEPQRVPVELDGQVQLAQRGDWVLIAEEYSGANPHVVDLRSGKVSFSSAGRDAVWLPPAGVRQE